MAEMHFLSGRDVRKLRTFVNNRNFQVPGRRRRGKRGGTTTTTTGGGGVLIVLVDEDIDPGITEDATIELTAEGTAGTEDDILLETLDGTPVDFLNLACYERKELNLKYFVEAGVSDPGYEVGKVKMILATAAVTGTGTDGTGTDTGQETKTYDTQVVFYDDGKAFKVGEYKKIDYPDYPEDEVFPPDGTGTYDEAPEGFFNRRYRMIAVRDDEDNWILVTGLCQVVPAPSLESLLSGS